MINPQSEQSPTSAWRVRCAEERGLFVAMADRRRRAVEGNGLNTADKYTDSKRKLEIPPGQIFVFLLVG